MSLGENGPEIELSRPHTFEVDDMCIQVGNFYSLLESDYQSGAITQKSETLRPWLCMRTSSPKLLAMRERSSEKAHFVGIHGSVSVDSPVDNFQKIFQDTFCEQLVQRSQRPGIDVQSQSMESWKFDRSYVRSGELLHGVKRFEPRPGALNYSNRVRYFSSLLINGHNFLVGISPRIARQTISDEPSQLHVTNFASLSNESSLSGSELEIVRGFEIDDNDPSSYVQLFTSFFSVFLPMVKAAEQLSRDPGASKVRRFFSNPKNSLNLGRTIDAHPTGLSRITGLFLETDFQIPIIKKEPDYKAMADQIRSLGPHIYVKLDEDAPSKPTGHTRPQSFQDKNPLQPQEVMHDKSLPAVAPPEGVEAITPLHSLDEIMLPDVVRSKVDEVVFSFLHPEIIKQYGVDKPNGVLFYGEPGTGKTMIAHAIAKELDASFWFVDTTSIRDMWLGTSPKNVANIFNAIKKHKGHPLVVFFDEIDSILGRTIDASSPGGAASELNAVIGKFKTELHNLSKSDSNALVVGATNNLDNIDDAVIRSGRFDYKIYVPLPELQARTALFGSRISSSIAANSDSYSDDIDVPCLAENTEGMSGADIAEVFRRLGIRKALQEHKTGEKSPISQEDILATIQDFKTNG